MILSTGNTKCLATEIELAMKRDYSTEIPPFLFCTLCVMLLNFELGNFVNLSFFFLEECSNVSGAKMD